MRENRRFPLPERQPQPPEFLHRAKSLADGVMGTGTKSLLKPLCSERWRLCRIAARPRSPLAPPPLRPSLTLPLQRPASVRPIEAHTPGPSTPSPPESLRGGSPPATAPYTSPQTGGADSTPRTRGRERTRPRVAPGLGSPKVKPKSGSSPGWVQHGSKTAAGQRGDPAAGAELPSVVAKWGRPRVPVPVPRLPSSPG